MSSIESELRNNSILRRQYEELFNERFGYTLHRPNSPHDIVKMLRLDDLALDIHRREATLRFDGRALQWIEDGEVTRRWPAVSGRPGYHGKEHQHTRELGPLPEGRYSALQDDFQRWEETNIFNRAACLLRLINIKAGRWPGCTRAWGTRRIGLEPRAGTKVFGRSNFTIHGGSYPGSAGCIDLTSSMESFAKEFLYYAKDMELEVRY
ncbi:L,D-transpeptidase [Cupriavidus sp. DL-D2]|uniref:L,D-transpeptidase n=1 Tax=Cupriavidus sp. DL-D2 TaxID=3144974 RepID=UPI00321226FC